MGGDDSIWTFIANPSAGFEEAASIISTFRLIPGINNHLIVLDWVCSSPDPGEQIWMHGHVSHMGQQDRQGNYGVSSESGEIITHRNHLHFKRHMQISAKMS